LPSEEISYPKENLLAIISSSEIVIWMVSWMVKGWMTTDTLRSL
jgi:hypothetical protein